MFTYIKSQIPYLQFSCFRNSCSAWIWSSIFPWKQPLSKSITLCKSWLSHICGNGAFEWNIKLFSKKYVVQFFYSSIYQTYQIIILDIYDQIPIYQRLFANMKYLAAFFSFLDYHHVMYLVLSRNSTLLSMYIQKFWS